MNNVTGKEDDEVLKKTAFRDQLYDNEDDELLKTAVFRDPTVR
jgi:hypothetical protein